LNKDGLTLALKREKMSDNFTETISVGGVYKLIIVFCIKKYYAKLNSYACVLRSLFDLDDGMICAHILFQIEKKILI